MTKPTTTLKTILGRREATIFAGAANGLFARIIEDLGYEAVYVTGAGIANMYLGAPDIGLTTLTEIANHVAAISDAVAVPLLVDADTGFGNAVNMVRTVKVLERAGAAGLQIEDQVFPKKCGHFDGKEVVPLQEMLATIKAAVDTRRDGDLQIVARTDARAILGLQAAIDRAGAMIEAGADATFVEAPTSAEELAQIASSLSVPQVANVVFGGKTPELGREKFAELGFGCVLYANAALQAALKASHEVLAALKQEGSLASVADRLAGFDIRQQAVSKPKYDALERRYRGG
ncbi:MAG TPA: oxaloacetate decarboxylase [Bradyrhizobium sp.]|uniref:isocitrate lyase/PEP mutase family protein n=1 Tax=Bradyrhizobium sp. TaxID=376 RepID=UPI002D7F9A5F|nr:oxaloacetate decarboxylase [Bradyrhizobium sp.]HET7889088.1 oxaloacetate decarboxylase [Bradyrhizobium sp.]